MYNGHVRELVIRPALHKLDLWSSAAEALLMGTAAQESAMGEYLAQLAGGPALGIFQMEPATHDDIWVNYLGHRESLALKVLATVVMDADTIERVKERRLPPDPMQMAWNLHYAAAMARVHYRRVPAPLPYANDEEGLARYWKEHYNTPAGAGTVEEFAHNYRRFVT